MQTIKLNDGNEMPSSDSAFSKCRTWLWPRKR